MATRKPAPSRFRDNSTLRAIAHVAVRFAFDGLSAGDAIKAIRAGAAQIGVTSLQQAEEVFGANAPQGEIKDPRLSRLIEKALAANASRKLLNALYMADAYNGVLEALVIAGSMADMAKKLGVSHQAVQQWVDRGYVPLVRIPEIESVYGIPRADLMNPKYAAILAEPKFQEV